MKLYWSPSEQCFISVGFVSWGFARIYKRKLVEVETHDITNLTEVIEHAIFILDDPMDQLRWDWDYSHIMMSVDAAYVFDKTPTFNNFRKRYALWRPIP